MPAGADPLTAIVRPDCAPVATTQCRRDPLGAPRFRRAPEPLRARQDNKAAADGDKTDKMVALGLRLTLGHSGRSRSRTASGSSETTATGINSLSDAISAGQPQRPFAKLSLPMILRTFVRISGQQASVWVSIAAGSDGGGIGGLLPTDGTKSITQGPPIATLSR